MRPVIGRYRREPGCGHDWTLSLHTSGQGAGRGAHLERGRAEKLSTGSSATVAGRLEQSARVTSRRHSREKMAPRLPVRADMGSAFVARGEGAGRFFGPGPYAAWHLEAHASHARAGEVAQPGPLACASQGDEVHGFPERTWSADLSPSAEVREVCLVDLAIAAEHPRQRATQEHRWPEPQTGPG
jgi:hypothetical protein